MRCMEGLFQGIERTCSDVSKDHSRAAKAVAGKVAFGRILHCVIKPI